MATNSIITSNGKKTFIYRAYTENADLSSTQYLPVTQYKIGINNATPNTADATLTNIIPLDTGTVCDDGTNTLTGSNGGDDSTDNIVTYKEGANATDDTAQNLITTGSNTTKTWTIADLTVAGANCDATKYIGLWLYILDATTLAKFASTGTCLELRIGADITTNYYSQVYEASDLSTGWNWLSDNELLSTWTDNGTPGTLNDFAIIITTNNATDAFVAGDVVYDLLRQWEATDLVADTDIGYPTFNLTNFEVTQRVTLNTLQANGFNINGLGLFNEDSSPLMLEEDTYNGNSKSRTDEFVYIIKNRVL